MIFIPWLKPEDEGVEEDFFFLKTRISHVLCEISNIV